MPDFNTLAGGATESSPSPGSSTTVVVSDASTDTKGSWSQLIASTAYPTAWVVICPQNVSSIDSYLIDIGVGASTAEKVIIPDLHYKANAGAADAAGGSWTIPVSIPAGTRLSVRCASSSSGADSVNIGITCIAAQMASTVGFRCEGFGANTTGSTGTTIDPGGTANTEGSWTQLIASTAFPYRWLALSVRGNNIAAATNWLLDIGIGANPNEKILIPDLGIGASSNGDVVSPSTINIPVNIPAGTRLSARCQCSLNTATNRNLLVSGVGCG